MDEQQFFNIAVGLISALLGWLTRIMWNSIKELQTRDLFLNERVTKVEVLVAGQYIKREEMDAKVNALFSKLDRIEDKLDRKVDKV